MGSQIKNYYTTLKHLSDVFDRQARKMPAPDADLELLKRWQKNAKQKFSELLGMDKMETCPLNPELLDSVQMEGYRRDHIIIQTQPDMYMPIFALIPDGIPRRGKRPAFMSQMGHGPGKFMTTDAADYDGYAKWQKGLGERPKNKKTIADFNIGLAKEGYLVFASDAIGAGERREFMDQRNDKFGGNSHNALNNLGISMGLSVAGMQVWDLMRMTDYILSREDSDGRVAVGGMSGGGHQSLFFSALDERVQATITSGWFYGFKDALLYQPHNCSCNYVPGLWNYFDCCDIGSMIAPRPLHIESGAYDHLNSDLVGVGNVLSQVELTRRSYDLYLHGEELLHFIHPGVHEWNGGKAFDFMHKYMPLKDNGEGLV